MDDSLVYDDKLLRAFFDMQVANIVRTKSPFTIVFITMHPETKVHLQQEKLVDESSEIEKITDYLKGVIRASDAVFKCLNPSAWAVLLTHSGEMEAKYFATRIFDDLPPVYNSEGNELEVKLIACVVEVANSKAQFVKVMQEVERSLQQVIDADAHQMISIQSFKAKETFAND